ncbi:unnamed protein product [Ambrosiozyma monospora]|uniref:Unnamed protein product n=1 Tax=Ambrosiozyma monospora TaxID=43982 RepID=A0A9W6YTS4_AMBMO|nr:unnamed protein product [Ambrosiozyma monospora]
MNKDKWLIFQETGWTLYETGASVLSYVISSPLSCHFRKLVLSDSTLDSIAILMNNGDLMYVNSQHVNLINGDSSLIDACNCDGDVVGCFTNLNGNLILRKLNTVSMKWEVEAQSFIDFNGLSCNKYFKEFGQFVVENNQELLIKLKRDQSVLNNLGSFGYVHEVIDITPILCTLSHTLIVVGESPKLTILQLNADMSWVIKKFTDHSLNFKQLSIVDGEPFLLVDDRTIVNLETLIIQESLPKSCMGAGTLEIFHSDGKLIIGDVIQESQDCLFNNRTTIIPFDCLLDNEEWVNKIDQLLLGDADQIYDLGWLAVGTSSDAISFINTENLPFSKYPLLFPFLLKLLSKKGADEFLLSYQLENFGCIELYKLLCDFCFSSNESIALNSFSILDQLLSLFEREALPLILHAKETVGEISYFTLEKEVDQLHATIICCIVHSHNSSLLNNSKTITCLLSNILHFLKSENQTIVKLMLKLLGDITVKFIQKKVISPIKLLSDVFGARDRYMKKFPHLQLFTAFNEYLNTTMKQAPAMMTVLLGYMLNKDGTSIELQGYILDYVNYLFIEMPFTINCNDLFLLVISLIHYFINLEDHHEENKRLWDTLSLTSNILTTKFHDSVGFHFKMSGALHPEFLLNSAQHEGKLCIMLDDESLQIGYTGVVLIRDDVKHNKHHQKNWHIKYLKRMDRGLGNNINKINLETVKSEMGTHGNLTQPMFSWNGTKLACLDLERYSILIYDLNLLENDKLSAEALKNDYISMMFPKFGSLFLQSYWNLNNFTGGYHQVPLSKAFEMSTSDFLDEDVHVTEKCCCQLIEEISIIDLLYKYFSVFPDIKMGDVDLEWLSDGRIELKLQGKTIFIFTLDESKGEADV